MPTDHHLEPDDDALAKLGYELEDIESRGRFKSMVWFFAFVFGCGAAGVAIFGAFIGFDNLLNPPKTTAPFVKRVPAPNNPLLQTNVTARTDIRDLRQEEGKLMNEGPSFVDEKAGIVRIPLGLAIDQYVAKQGGNVNEKTTIASGAPPYSPPKHEEAGGGGH